MNNKVVFTKDLANKKLHVTREFAAPADKVWKAWTESELLDKWWAPKPWKAETKTMDFRLGGKWLYSMVSPEGERHWSNVDFLAIKPKQSFSTTCRFSDENGVANESTPAMHWAVEFHSTSTGAKVEVELTFDTTEGFEKIIQMGFEGGFTMGLNNLEELLPSL